MERSLETTEYIIVKALTTSQWDNVDFAIVHLTEEMLASLKQRLTNVQPFRNDNTFHNLAYWDSPVGYYCNPKDIPLTETILNKHEDWTFVKLDKDELETFPIPENPLEAHQLLISSHGYANFKAISKYTDEEYSTEWFSISDVLSLINEKSINSS